MFDDNLVHWHLPFYMCSNWTYDDCGKGWDPTFLIRAISLSEKLIISFDFVFSDLGMKYQNLQVYLKKITCFLVQSFLILDKFLE